MASTTGAKVLANMFKGYGITHVFYMPQVISTALVEMEDLGIRRVVAHSEKGAAYMADGYARAKGTPGICLSQPIGASNLASGLRDAFMAHTPLIAISGGPMPASRYRYAYQEVEDFSQFDPVTKANYNVDTVARLPDMMRQAFRDATTGCPGPVHLRFQGRRSDGPLGEGDIEALCEPIFSAVPPFRPEPERERVREGVAALVKAKRPVIIAGGGVVHSSAQKEVVELAELLRIPVATSLNGKGTILENHPLALGVVGTYSRESTNRAVHEADLVFYIGSPAGGMVTGNWTVPAVGTDVMQLDIEANELGRNFPNKVSLLGDAKATLTRMIEEARGIKAGDTMAWVARVQELVATWREQFAPRLASDDMPMRPERLCRELEEAMPADAILVADTGHAGMWTSQMIELKQPGQRYIRCAGSLGWGLPGAMGVKVALPDRPVVCFTGDGGMYYHLPELETALRYGINLVVVVNNNGALSQELPQLTLNYGGRLRGNADEMWRFSEFNFAKVAQAMGCEGIRVEKPEDLKDALRKAFAMNKPVVVEVITDVNIMAPLAWVPK